MTNKNMKKRFYFSEAILILLFTVSAVAQTTEFTYQGKLSSSGSAATGTFEMQFRLYDAASGGTPIGSPVTNASVAVAQGIFTVQLDFGAAAFPGADRFLEIGVRPSGSANAFTLLAPRQKITSAPYAIKSKTADEANNAANLGGVAASEYVTTTSVGNSFIKNSTTQQTGANFSIDGNGVIGGSVGIGAAPQAGIKLDVTGNSVFRTANGNINFGSPSGEMGITIIGTNRADFRFNNSTLKLVAGTGSAPPPDTNGIVITTAGKVIIGATPPYRNAKLHVDGSLENGIFSSSNFGTGVQGSGTTNGISGIGVGGATGVNGFSENGIGVQGASNGGNNFGVFASGFLGMSRLGSASSPNTSLCLNGSNQISACGSSLRYKKDFQPFNDGLSFINQLRPISYKWKSNDAADIGFGAEDVAKINPLFAVYNDKGEVEGLKYDRLSVVFVNAFKEQQTQIEQQNQQIERQNQQIKEQQNRLESQQQQIDGLKKLICQTQPEAKICQ